MAPEHVMAPHSSRRLRRLAIAAPPPLPIKWACSQATVLVTPLSYRPNYSCCNEWDCSPSLFATLVLSTLKLPSSLKSFPISKFIRSELSSLTSKYNAITIPSTNCPRFFRIFSGCSKYQDSIAWKSRLVEWITLIVLSLLAHLLHTNKRN